MSATTIYDHPLYYDILFDWDRSDEAAFYQAVFERAGATPPGPVLEVACGTGLIGRRLAKLGWAVSGLDLSAAMLEFLEQRAREEGTNIDTIRADMRSFEVASPFAAALNPMSSFRMLQTDAEAIAHLRCMAAALRPGGVYVLDLALVADPSAPAKTTDEEWEMERGEIRVRARDDGLFVDDAGREHELAWGDEVHLRPYTSEAVLRLVDACAEFEIRGWHRETMGPVDDIGRFEADAEPHAPLEGRVMLQLCRV